MILDFGCFVINEASLKKLKKNLHGVLNMSARKRMRKELRDNIITFKFKKRNGEIRTAHGTLHPDYLPKLRGGAPRPEHQMVYYDLDKLKTQMNVGKCNLSNEILSNQWQKRPQRLLII